MRDVEKHDKEILEIYCILPKQISGHGTEIVQLLLH